MNVAETTKLVELIAGIVPAQRFTRETPALWAGVLRDVRLTDALEAVRRVPRREGFIDPADIVGEVERIRDARLAASDRILPDVDPDDVHGWIAARRAGVAALADGRADPPAELDGEQDRRVAAALPSVFRRPERPRAADYSAAPLKAITASVGAETAAQLERERERQIAALAAMTTDA